MMPGIERRFRYVSRSGRFQPASAIAAKSHHLRENIVIPSRLSCDEKLIRACVGRLDENPGSTYKVLKQRVLVGQIVLVVKPDRRDGCFNRRIKIP